MSYVPELVNKVKPLVEMNGYQVMSNTSQSSSQQVGLERILSRKLLLFVSKTVSELEWNL